MKDKISKIISVIKKDGLFITIAKTCKYINAKHGYKINIFKRLYYKINRKKYEKIISDIFDDNEFDRIIIFKDSLGWNIPLFQRPQHMARELSKNRCLVFFEVTSMTDNVKDIKSMSQNLFLVNVGNLAIIKIILENIYSCNKPKYINCYSTDYKTPVFEIRKYRDRGFKIIYEYIDDLSPLIVGTNEIPINIKDKYELMLEDRENIFVVVTADRLKEDVINNRGKEKLVLACNGVDYQHFTQINNDLPHDEQFLNILKQGKNIIGYYGALASWMDYDLLKYIAEKRPNYNIVLFGVKYDESYKKSNIDKYENIYFLGNKDYKVLKNYAYHFDVCMIPFKVNEITRATSPVKLFEYMALEKPIVTTDMDECRKYESVHIAKSNDEFIFLIDKSITMKDNIEYKLLLKKEALENTWEMKAKSVIKTLEEYE